MASVAGYLGVALWNSNQVAGVTSWDSGIDVEELDNTANDVIYKTFIPGQYSGTGSVEFHFDGSNTAIAAIYADALTGTERDLALQMDSTANNQISGNAIVTNVSTSASQGSTVTVSASFRFTGAITVATA